MNSFARVETYRRLSRAFWSPDAAQEPEFRALFGPAALDCPPYETQYGLSNVFQQSDALADIAGFYRAFGLEPSAARPERFDHVAVELEFLAYLGAKEEHARGRGEDARGLVCRDAAREFLAAHLGRWAGAFAARLRERATGPYRALAGELERFVDAECRRLGAEPKRAAGLGVAPEEAYSACFSCGAQEGA